jgi:ubiquinone biosynthesis protein UbiJ
MTLQNVLSDLNIDWEAPMVGLLGPIIGHQLANLLRGLTTTSKVAHQSARRQLSEFILEEARLSPPRAELDDFLGSVDDMVLRVDRAESRLKRLKNRVDILTGASA